MNIDNQVVFCGYVYLQYSFRWYSKISLPNILSLVECLSCALAIQHIPTCVMVTIQHGGTIVVFFTHTILLLCLHQTKRQREKDMLTSLKTRIDP